MYKAYIIPAVLQPQKRFPNHKMLKNPACRRADNPAKFKLRKFAI